MKSPGLASAWPQLIDVPNDLSKSINQNLTMCLRAEQGPVAEGNMAPVRRPCNRQREPLRIECCPHLGARGRAR